jgi:uncharacterized protein YqhQ
VEIKISDVIMATLLNTGFVMSLLFMAILFIIAIVLYLPTIGRVFKYYKKLWDRIYGYYSAPQEID